MKIWTKILIGLVIIIFNVFVYVILGLLLMNYDDFYEESKGEYWSFESMTTFDKLTVIGLNIWNVINLIAIGFIIYMVIEEINKRTTTK